MDSVMKELMGAVTPHNLWARTAPGQASLQQLVGPAELCVSRHTESSELLLAPSRRVGKINQIHHHHAPSPFISHGIFGLPLHLVRNMAPFCLYIRVSQHFGTRRLVFRETITRHIIMRYDLFVTFFILLLSIGSSF